MKMNFHHYSPIYEIGSFELVEVKGGGGLEKLIHHISISLVQLLKIYEY